MKIAHQFKSELASPREMGSEFGILEMQRLTAHVTAQQS